ncbi:LacI family DNA-binding transcriptional regulator [Celeribacter sp.]|uniref:LacI family DNA-binding transcriptional regulator n=1 Tax=Celeribacter sp. TaxID=1890673 RepID=UPI003A8FC0BD
MTTLKDLSRHLGISVTQISRALNDHSDVSEATKERVRRGAKELGYSANRSARSLKTGRSGMVSLIRAGHLTFPSDLAALDIISGLSMEFSARDIQFALQMTDQDADVETIYGKAIGSGSFDGFVLIDLIENDPRIDIMEKAGVPYVTHGRASAEAKHPFFDIDNFAVAKWHTEHLIGLGHRRIAMLNGPKGYAYAQRRLEGYQAALREAGLPFNNSLVIHCTMTEAKGSVATAQLFAEGRERPTGIICANVFLARGAYSSLEALQLSVPSDVSIIAHDDVLSNIRTSAFYPALTVTRSPFERGWKALSRFLCDAIENGMDDRSRLQEVADFEFIERASTARA